MAMEGLILRTQAEPDLAELVALYAFGRGIDPYEVTGQATCPMLRDRYEGLKEQAEMDQALTKLNERSDPKHADKYATKYTFVGC